MAFSFVQTKQNNTTGTSLTVTMDAPVTLDSLVVVHLKFGGGVGAADITMTDNAPTPNTYNLAVGPSSSGGQICFQFYGVAKSAGATQISVSWLVSTGARITVDEFSGGLASNYYVFDRAASASGTSLSASCSISPGDDGYLISAGVGLVSATGVSAGSGYTMATTNTSASSAYKLSGTTSETAPFTLTGSGSTSWNEVVGAYIAVMPPSVPIRPEQLLPPQLDISMNSNRITDLLPASASTDAATFGQVSRPISVNTTTVGNVGTGEDDLMTYSVPASTLGANNTSLEFRAAGTIANNVNAKRIKVHFGATTIFDSGAAGIPVSAAIDWVIEGKIIRTGAATQKCLVTMNTNNATLAAYSDYATAGETLSGAVTLKLTGEAVSSDDIIQEIMAIDWCAAP